MGTGRDDFRTPTVTSLAKRVGYRCSRPKCRALTVGPKSSSPGDVMVGIASHITAASANGPRYDPSLSAEQRRSFDNGIWLCQFCAKLIDADPARFPVDLLRLWKTDAEKLAEAELGLPTGTRPDYADGSGNAALGVPGGPRYHYWAIESFDEYYEFVIDRQQELNDLEGRARSGGCTVIEGEPWAGKSALMSALGRRLRNAGDFLVVQFYVVLGSAATAEHFLTAVNNQLLDVLLIPGGIRTGVTALTSQFLALWDGAVDYAVAQEKVLVLLVDALDEQDLDDSLMSLLPVHVPRGASVIVSTRPLPDVGAAVPPNHALNRASIYCLETSPHAVASKRAAEQSIHLYLEQQHDETARDLLGFLAYAGGAMSVEELGELTGLTPGQVRRRLARLERNLRESRDADNLRCVELAHATLKIATWEWFGTHREQTYTDRLIEWACQYQARGWPVRETPLYLLRQLDALVEKARWRPDRRALLMQFCNAQRAYAMRERLDHAQPLLTSLESQHHTALRESATVEAWPFVLLEHFLRATTDAIPARVFGALAATRQSIRALALARAVTDDGLRACALAEIAAATEDLTVAEEALRTLESTRGSTWGSQTLARVAAAVSARQPERALEIAGVLSGYDAADALVAISRTAPDEALGLARATTSGDVLMLVQTAVAHAKNDRMLVEEALDYANRIPIKPYAARALAPLAAATDDAALADRAFEAASTTSDPNDQRWALIAVAPVRPQGVLRVARKIADNQARADVLAAVALNLCDTAVAEEAVTVARSIVPSSIHDPILATALRVMAISEPDYARRIAMTLSDDYERIATLTVVSQALARTRLDDALEVAHSIDRPPGEGRGPGFYEIDLAAGNEHNRALGLIATEIATSKPKDALRIARSIRFEPHRARSLAMVGSVLQDFDVVREAMDLAFGLPPSFDGRIEAMRAAAASLGEVRPQEALEIARSAQIADAGTLVRQMVVPAVIGSIAEALPIESTDFARQVSNTRERAELLAIIAGSTGNVELAHEVLGLIADYGLHSQVSSLLSLARVVPVAILGMVPTESLDADWGLVLEAAAQDDPVAAFQVAQSAPPGFGRVVALCAVSTVIGERCLSEALFTARGIRDNETRARALALVIGSSDRATSASVADWFMSLPMGFAGRTVP